MEKFHAQIEAIFEEAYLNGMKLREIADIFGHTITWAFDMLYGRNVQVVVNEKLIEGLRQCGYEIRVVKVGDKCGE